MEYPQKGGVRTPHEQAAGDFHPRYVLTPRLVGHLACGELAIEPMLGPVRVAEVRPGEHMNGNGGSGEEPYVRVRWRDEHGPSTATGRYPADRSFEVRMPDRHDRLLIRRGIDQATWHKREITDDTARLIAAHLNGSAGSALHGFAVDGHVDELLWPFGCTTRISSRPGTIPGGGAPATAPVTRPPSPTSGITGPPTWWGATSPRRSRIACGLPISPMFLRGLAWCTWRS